MSTSSNSPLDKDRKEAAVLVVDPQNDFFPGGSLAVKDGNQIIPRVNEWMESARNRGVPVFVSRDWHPSETKHFLPEGTWPAHCVQGTPGADFHKSLNIPMSAFVVTKGTSPVEDGTSYSAFRGTIDRERDWRHGLNLTHILQKMGIKRVYVLGLATDYCVKETVLDARKDGFDVFVVNDGVKAVNVDPSDERKAIEAMTKAGAKII